jgi:DnaJ-class molecular chaperone
MTEADRLQAAGTQINPGDDAPPGTLGTGEDICRDCHGSGRIDGKTCPACGGTGKVTEGVGGG